MIAGEERTILLRVLEVATELAAAGRVAAGYQYVLLGLHRAEALLQAGSPDGLALVRRYQAMQDAYARHHSVLWHLDEGTENRGDAEAEY